MCRFICVSVLLVFALALGVMSLGYNDRLSPLAWKGEVGDKETEEPRSKWLPKAAELAQWIRASKHTVSKRARREREQSGDEMESSAAVWLVAHDIYFRGSALTCSPGRLHWCRHQLLVWHS